MSEQGSDEQKRGRAADEEPREAPAEADARDADEWDEADDDLPRRRRRGVPLWVIALGVVLALIATYSLARIAGEQRYQSCVAAVAAHYGTASDPLTRLARIRTIDHCSRSPF
jgi:type VI protein secretion system component VasF